MKVYIAFSIPGTCAFITANKEVESVESLGKEFTIAKSRRPDYKPEDGIKLHWSMLLTQKKDVLKSPAWVIKRFHDLEKQGWTINKTQFVKRHYHT